MDIGFIFPGQGSQYAGMGSDLHEEFAVARDVYARASEVLGYDIAELSFKDPEDTLNLTRYTQPALLTHSFACLQVFRELTDDRLAPATPKRFPSQISRSLSRGRTKSTA